MIEQNGVKEFFADPKKKQGFFADLHIHSRFSRACSKDLNLDNLEKWARIKGIDLLGTGDFTHPIWIEELRKNLKDNGKGILENKTGFKFILTGEISLMYTQGRGRSVHLVMLAPSFEVVDKINSYLDKKGRRDYDGRPIFKISCEQFTKDMKEIEDKIEIIPAHIWTPFFGVLGSRSGFDSLKEAFGSQMDKIHAVETGISSTPEMNLKLKELQGKTIVSFSDSHSFWPWRLGREATILKDINSYDEIIRELRENDIIGTIEVNPAYGMYHFDGHRDCLFSCGFEETKKLNKICPKCKKLLTVGVDYRVNELSDVKEKIKTKKVYEILPLHELIAAHLDSSMTTKKTWEVYNKIIASFGNELNVLISVSKEELEKVIEKKLVDLIILNREGKINVKPGYDGLYGVMIYEGKQMSVQEPAKKEKDICEEKGQKKLF
jgi:uncharacterized protein (TIGR00375 family)